MTEYKVLAVGEVLFDVINGAYKLGGAPFNVAAHMAKLGNESFILSAVGQDELGDQIINEAEDLGVNTDLIFKNAQKKTGTVQVEFENGEPEYEIVRDVAWDYLEVDFDRISTKKWSVVALGSLAQRSTHNQTFYHKLFSQLQASWIYFDCNLRQEFFTKSVLEKSLHFANIGKFNEHEIKVASKLIYDEVLLPEDFARRLNADFLIDLVVYTWGKAGSKAWYRGNMLEATSDEVKTKDTVGAGDAFSAGFLHTWVRTKDVEESLKKGNQLGGYVASHAGAIPPYTEELTSNFNL